MTKSLGSFLKVQFFCGKGRNLFITVTLLWVCIFRSCCGLVINSKEWPQGNCNMLMKPHTLHNFLEDSFYRFHIGKEMNHKKMCYLKNDKSFTTYFFFLAISLFSLLKHLIYSLVLPVPFMDFTFSGKICRHFNTLATTFCHLNDLIKFFPKLLHVCNTP